MTGLRDYANEGVEVMNHAYQTAQNHTYQTVMNQGKDDALYDHEAFADIWAALAPADAGDLGKLLSTVDSRCLPAPIAEAVCVRASERILAHMIFSFSFLL
jgi:hypothetical protein